MGSPARVVGLTLDAYDLAGAGVRLIRTTNNDVFEVSAPAARYALRVHRPAYRTPEQIRSELQFLSFVAGELRGTRIEVPRPVPTRGGELLVDVDGTGRVADLLTWVDGRELKPTRGLGPHGSFLVGEAIARLHEAAARFEPPPGFDLPRWDADGMLTTDSPFRPGPLDEFLPADALELLRELHERTRAIFAELDRGGGEWGIVHSDLVLVNCRFARRGGALRLGILDFDDAGFGYFLYDLAPVLGNFADFPERYGALRRALLAGYRSVRPLAPELEAHLPVLMAARHALTLVWLAGLHRNGKRELDVARFAAYRVAAARACLSLG